MISTELQAETVADRGITEPYQQETEISLLDLLIVLLAKKRFILRFVLTTMALAIVVALILPVQYEGQVVLLPPQQSSTVGGSLLGQAENVGALGSLAALAGASLGLKNPTDMYVSLLKSRTVADAMIRRFGLMQEYHTKKLSDARKQLARRTTAEAGTKDGLIRLAVQDHDPNRAAQLANGYVEEFRNLSASLAITEAARRRLFFEGQVKEAKEKLTAAEDAMSKTQQSTGVLQIDSQARALIESAAVLRAQVVAKQVQIEGMRSFATDDNPNVVLAKQELAALQAQLERVAGSQRDPGSDINLSKGRVTQEGMEYIRRYRDLRYQEAMYELLSKEFEVAKLDEAREGAIVQVIDTAIPPDKKSSPHRTLIVLISTICGFIVAGSWVIMVERLQNALQLPENRQRVRVARGLWKREPRSKTTL
jgi:tyrosine-protein kinase Etk/Wzc